MTPDCRACAGACCETMTLRIQTESSDFLRWIRLRSTPVHRGDQVEYNFTVPCSALQQGRCAVYDTRPDMCRDFVPGSEDCVGTVRDRRSLEDVAAILDEVA